LRASLPTLCHGPQLRCQTITDVGPILRWE